MHSKIGLRTVSGRYAIPEPLELSGDKLGLFRALERKSVRIAQIYIGALYALQDNSNPERFSCAAHQLRELMEKVPEVLDVQMPAGREHMKPRAQALQSAYESALTRTGLQPPNWVGTVDPAMARLLEELRKFVEWVKTHAVRRKDEVRGLLRALDGQAQALPPDLVDEALRAWDQKKTFFNDVCHHRRHPTSEQFHEQMSGLESFLLRKFNPPTFADFDALDALLAEGELNDQR